jgi:cytochrome c556
MSDEPLKDHENTIEEEELGEAPAPANRWPLAAAVFFFCAMIAGIAYGVRQRSQSEQMAAQYSQMNSMLSAARTQLAGLATKLNALEAEPRTARPVTPAPVAREKSIHTRRAAPHTRRGRAADPRWKQMQSQLANQQKQIAAAQQSIDQTKADLEGQLKSSHDELNGSIARSHEELVALEKRGQRNFYEFDLTKSKQFQRVGPIGIALRKANTRHLFCNLKLLVDDNLLTKKHVSLYEPVQFYPADYAQPLEIVIYQISKNEARGYVSAPRYRQSQLAAQAAANSSEANAQPAAPVAATSATSLTRRSEPQQ